MNLFRTSDPTRTAAFVAGILYLLTFVGSIASSLLLQPVMSGANYITGPGADAPIGLAAVLEMVNVLTCIGTAVAVFAVIRRRHQSLSIGFVSTRLFEGATITVGALSILAIGALQKTVADGVPAESVVPVATGLVAVRDYSLLIGPGMAGFNALMFGTALYRSRLVPRAILALGIVGAPLIICFTIATMLGLTGPFTIWQGIAVAPFFIWELVIGLWMTFKGFNQSSPIVADAVADAAQTRPAQALALANAGAA